METDPDEESLEYEPEFSYYALGLIVFGAFEGALYLLGVRGWWFAIGLLLASAVWWRYRWHTGGRERYRRAIVEALAKREGREKRLDDDR